MDVQRGSVIYSLAGRDKGKRLICMEKGEKAILVADGKERPIERPKKKNINHIKVTKTVLPEEKIKTNKSIRKALFEIMNGNKI